MNDIDKLIAEKLMGFVYVPSKEHHTGYISMEYCIDELGDAIYDFYPSDNITDAWRVIEKMQEDGWSWEIIMNNKAKEVDVRIGRGSSVNTSVPLAICKAALKHLEIVNRKITKK